MDKFDKSRTSSTVQIDIHKYLETSQEEIKLKRVDVSMEVRVALLTLAILYHSRGFSWNSPFCDVQVSSQSKNEFRLLSTVVCNDLFIIHSSMMPIPLRSYKR